MRWDIEDGKPISMTATINRDMLNHGGPAYDRIKPAGWDDDANNQSRGHLLANMLGGSGSYDCNLFTVTHNPTNTPDMYKYESMAYAFAKADGSVQYEVNLYYNGSSSGAPKEIEMIVTDVRGNTYNSGMIYNPASQ